MHHLPGYDYNLCAILKTSLKTLSIYEIRQDNPRTWQHLGRAKITNQIPSFLAPGTQTDPITPELIHVQDEKNQQKTTECDVKETCTRYLQYFTP